MPWQHLIEVNENRKEEDGYGVHTALLESRRGNQYEIEIPPNLFDMGIPDNAEAAFVDFDRANPVVTGFSASIDNNKDKPEAKDLATQKYNPEGKKDLKRWIEYTFSNAGWNVRKDVRSDNGNVRADAIADSEMGKVGIVALHRTKAGEGGNFASTFQRLQNARDSSFDGGAEIMWCLCTSYPKDNNPMKQPEGSDFMMYFVQQYGYGYIDSIRGAKIIFRNNDNEMKIPIERSKWGERYNPNIQKIWEFIEEKSKN